MKQQQLIVLIGLPSSGKSTWAREWVNEEPISRVRINRDDIRRQLGPYFVGSREELVTTIERLSVFEALKAGYSIVIDATNLNPKYYRWPQLLKQWLDEDSFPESTDIELIENKSFLEVPIEECIRRDSLREEKVGEEVIRRMAKFIK